MTYAPFFPLAGVLSHIDGLCTTSLNLDARQHAILVADVVASRHGHEDPARSQDKPLDVAIVGSVARVARWQSSVHPFARQLIHESLWVPKGSTPRPDHRSQSVSGVEAVGAAGAACSGSIRGVQWRWET